MKYYTSYFYNLRFLKPYQIPMSTAAWDPKWYYNNIKPGHVWKNSSGVYCGIRIPQLNPETCHASGCPCSEKNYHECRFLKEYDLGLRKIDFPALLDYIRKVAEFIKTTEGFAEEPEIVLLVYEVPSNPCSERVAIQELFRRNGIEIEEYVPEKKK